MTSEAVKLVSSIKDNLDLMFRSFAPRHGLGSYRETVRVNLHSWLQYVMIKAGLDRGFHAIPEYKIRHDEPIKGIDKERPTKLYKADVGFIKFGVEGRRRDLRS